MTGCVSGASLAFGQGFSLAETSHVLFSSRPQDPHAKQGSRYLHTRAPKHLPGLWGNGGCCPNVRVPNTGAFTKAKALGLQWSIWNVKELCILNPVKGGHLKWRKHASYYRTYVNIITIVTFPEGFLCARHFPCVSYTSSILTVTLWIRYYYHLHFIAEWELSEVSNLPTVRLLVNGQARGWTWALFFWGPHSKWACQTAVVRNKCPH